MNSFEALGLEQSLIKAIDKLGFEAPTPIQEKIIPLLLEAPTDVVALSQTGTGKTAAFGLPLLSVLDFDSKTTQGLVLCPTRELCVQIAKDLESFAQFIGGVRITTVYGGTSIVNQIDSLKRGSQIVVGTPGRMVDLINRKKIHLQHVNVLVLDEADEMLNMGFKEDLDTILSQTSNEKCTWLFSATMPNEVLRISKEYMYNPVEITVGSKNQGNENIEHIFYPLQSRARYVALRRIVDFNPEMFGIVFCRTRRETKEVADKLINDGYLADSLNGDLSQAQRDNVMNRYRKHQLQLLVATDVAARGIDVNDVTHVFHYSLPDELEYYVHRSGRTARAGKKGESIILAGPSDQNKIKRLEKMIKKPIVKGELPSAELVKEKLLSKVIENIKNAKPTDKGLAKILPQAIEAFGDLSREELIEKLLTLEYNRMPTVNNDNFEASDSSNSFGTGDKAKIFVNLGKFDNFDKSSLTAYLSKQSNIPEKFIKVLEIKNSFSMLRVSPMDAERLLEVFQKNIKFNNRSITLEISSRKNEKKSSRSRNSGGRKKPESSNSRRNRNKTESRRRRR